MLIRPSRPVQGEIQSLANANALFCSLTVASFRDAPTGERCPRYISPRQLGGLRLPPYPWHTRCFAFAVARDRFPARHPASV